MRDRGSDRPAHSRHAEHADIHRIGSGFLSKDSWFGLLAPRAVPKAILEKISKDWADALQTPDMQAKIKSQFLIGVHDTPEAMDKIVKEETENLTKVFKEAGI